MNRDDRLFAIIGGSVVTAAASIFLLFAGGITGTIDDRSTLRVPPSNVPEGTGVRVAADQPASPPEMPPDVVYADHDPARTDLGDDAVRALVSGISAHPLWASWLVTDDLLHRFVTSVEAVADGYSPSAELGFMAARGPFLVREDEGRLVIAAGTFRRYGLAVGVLSSVDAHDAVAVFRRLEPEIEALRGDRTWHPGRFEDRLRAAVNHLLAVEIPIEPIEVERRTVSYAFADEGYEMLSPAQRQLLRMGRSNATSIQGKLRDLRRAFGWPEESPSTDHRSAVADEGAPSEPAPALVAGLDSPPPLPRETSEPVTAVASAEPMVTPYDPRVEEFVSPLLGRGPGPPTVPTLP